MMTKKHTELTVHLLVWGLILCFPLLFFAGELSRGERMFMKSWMPVVFSAIIFYLNYFLIVDKFLFTKKAFRFIGINLLLILVSVFLVDILRDFFITEDYRHHHRHRHYDGIFKTINYYKLIRYVFTFVLTIGVSVGFKMFKRWQATELEYRKRENENLKSELNHLKYQLQPHFFLNTLNGIYALTDSSTDKAKEAIHSLGKLMRHLLYKSNEEKVMLNDEIEFIRKYVALMMMRMHDHVKVDMEFPQEGSQIKIPPLLFIPLVENAFKHGVSANKSSHITLRMKIEEGAIVFTVQNSYYPKTEEDRSGSGIGLENLKKRLEILFGNEYEFTQKQEGDFYFSYLKIKPHE